MVNINRLKTALKQRNITIEQASEAIGIHPATFYRRIDRQGAKFTIEEVDALVKLLGIDNDDVAEIFFAEELA